MSTLSLSRFLGEWLPKVEAEMHSILANDEPAVAAHYGMMRYHMGWVNQQFQPDPAPSGKRLRPMLCLLACSEVGGDPMQALPAAASLEILHNFSLIHDDIEDGDEMRRHRPTVWKVWGAPQAINAGDGMFALAFAAMQRLSERGVAPAVSLAALRIFTQMCLDLTEGQHLDMGFEQRQRVSVGEYMRMIQGKTAALVGASVEIGALVGGASVSQSGALQRFGQAIGLAFQIQDDILGIWGDPAVTGKAAGNDILRRKKSLPILYAINHAQVGERLAALFDDATFDAARLDEALDLLEQAGTRAFAEQQMRSQNDRGVAALHEALGERADGSALLALTESLLHRAH